MQESGKPEMFNFNTTSIPKHNRKDSPTINDNNNSKNLPFHSRPTGRSWKKEQVQKSHKNYMKSSMMYLIEDKARK